MQFDIKWLNDPQVFAVNRLPARATHSSVNGAGNSLSVSLNGQWRFHYATVPEQAPNDFFAVEYNSDAWVTIPVPGYIQMQGDGKYGTPHYVNTMYPWDGHEKLVPPQIPQAYNPVGSYVHSFSVPKQWENQPVLLRFDGVETAVAVWCNGQFIGYSEDSFTPAEFDLTDVIYRDKPNILAVQVFRFTSASWLEDQDFWRFSGIFRDVTLFTIPKGGIWDVQLSPVLHADGTGTLTADVSFYHDTPHEIMLQVDDSIAKMTPTHVQTALSIEVASPRLWSAEAPNLYDCTIILRNDDGEITEKTTLRVGFRTFALQNGLMMLNGKRIVFKGVNRHEWNCHTGRVVTQADMLCDIQTMKRNNINAVRTSHYPNRTEWYDLCDAYGLYVIDEMNLETHGTWQKMGAVTIDENTLPNDNLLWKDAVLDRANSMYQRDKNHASVLIWSCGNESCGGSVLHDASWFFRKKDSSRLVHYEGVFHDRRYPDTSDMESQMYTPVTGIIRFLAENPQKPFIMCEYAHAMGNSCGALHKYTDLTDTQPRYQGGFIWDYIDQGILSVNDDGQEIMAYGGDFGDRPTDGNFCGNGIVYADRTVTPKMAEVCACYQNFAITVDENKISIENKSLFTNLSQYDVVATLLRDGKILLANTVQQACAPGETVTLALPFALPQDDENDIVDVMIALQNDTVWAQKGHVVARGQKILHKKKYENQCKLPVTVVEGDVNIGIKGARFSLIFAKNAGLISYRYDGREMLKAPLAPNFWRAPTDNDKGWNMAHHLAQWKTAGMDAILTNCRVRVAETEACITADYQTPNGENLAMQYQITGDGRVETALIWQGEAVENVPEFSVQITVPSAYCNVEYDGMGPAENYADRLRGAYFGRFSYTAKEALCPYLKPQESGARTGVMQAKLTDDDGHGMVFYGDAMMFSALHYTVHEIQAAQHPAQLPSVCKTVVRCGAGQMGVGGDDSWGAMPHAEYRLPLKKGQVFTFAFGGI